MKTLFPFKNEVIFKLSRVINAIQNMKTLVSSYFIGSMINENIIVNSYWKTETYLRVMIRCRLSSVILVVSANLYNFRSRLASWKQLTGILLFADYNIIRLAHSIYASWIVFLCDTPDRCVVCGVDRLCVMKMSHIISFFREKQLWHEWLYAGRQACNLCTPSSAKSEPPI